MRIASVIALVFLAACSKGAQHGTLRPGYYLGEGRNRLCVKGEGTAQQVAFIAYGQIGDSNCAAEGRVEVKGYALALVPRGEGDCRIPIGRDGDIVRLGPGPAACAYYCGPGSSLTGQTYRWADTSTAEIAPDPLMPGDVC